MSRSAKPAGKQPESQQPGKPLADQELEKVSGGKASTTEITITKKIDKSSP